MLVLKVAKDNKVYLTNQDTKETIVIKIGEITKNNVSLIFDASHNYKILRGSVYEKENPTLTTK